MTSAAPLTHAYSWAEFIELDDTDRRELLHGNLQEVHVPTELHEWVVGFVFAALLAFGRRVGGKALPSGYKVRIDAHSGVRPDIQFYRPGRGPNPPQGLDSGAPDLVVEVISESSRAYDRITKREWYQRIGVPEYWLVDPSAQTIERLVLDGASYRIVQAVARPGRFAPPSFPGLEIDLDELLRVPE
jgi:Uma2 family endonuclease